MRETIILNTQTARGLILNMLTPFLPVPCRTTSAPPWSINRHHEPPIVMAVIVYHHPPKGKMGFTGRSHYFSAIPGCLLRKYLPLNFLNKYSRQ